MMKGVRKPINKDTVESVRHKLTRQVNVPGQPCFLRGLIKNTSSASEELFFSLGNSVGSKNGG